MYEKIAKLDQMIADLDMITSVVGRLFEPGLRAEIVELKEEIEREDV
jgi:hypothetical protein